jgi:hypothetical protein
LKRILRFTAILAKATTGWRTNKIRNFMASPVSDEVIENPSQEKNGQPQVVSWCGKLRMELERKCREM